MTLETTDPRFMCRMYENEFPVEGEIVVGVVKDVTDLGAFVTLSEYGDKDALVLLGELSRKRSKSLNSLIRMGRTEYLAVMRVDKEKGCIDLSKSRVTPEEMKECEARYSDSKQVQTIAYNVLRTREETMTELYESIVWPLYRQGGHALDYFKAAVEDPTVITSLGASVDLTEALLKEIRVRLVRPPSKIRAVFAIHCFASGGVTAIKDALHKGAALSTERNVATIKLVTHPNFALTTKSSSDKEGVEFLGKVIETIKERIEELNGGLSIREAPYVVNAKDEDSFNAFVESSARGNRLVDGDDDDSE